MSTNPNNAVGTNAAYSGRTSVNAFNDDLAAYTNGILSGWACNPSSGLTITLGGEADTRDVAIAQDSNGNKTTINNISGSPISVTIGTPPASNSRIDAVVAYVDNPPQGVTAVADNPAACGLITVEGTAAVTPTAPNDSAIRTAITADGASGSTAYYVVLALVTVASGTTDITSNDIDSGDVAQISGGQIPNGSITEPKIDFATMKNYASSMPVVSTTANMPFDTKIAMTRIGDLVIAMGTFVVSDIPERDNVPAWEKVPSGYRPWQQIWVPWTSTQGQHTNMGAWTIDQNGSTTYSLNTALSGQARFSYSATWITYDPFPGS